MSCKWQGTAQDDFSMVIGGFSNGVSDVSSSEAIIRAVVFLQNCVRYPPTSWSPPVLLCHVPAYQAISQIRAACHSSLGEDGISKSILFLHLLRRLWPMALWQEVLARAYCWLNIEAQDRNHEPGQIMQSDSDEGANHNGATNEDVQSLPHISIFTTGR